MGTTVKVLIFDQKGRILLVHEKGDGKRYFGKQRRWGLPGGGVELAETIEDIYYEIIKLLREQHLFKDELLIYIPKNNSEILAAIRETLEETGFLIRAKKEVFREQHSESDHTLVLFQGEIIDGELLKSSPETDDAGWFYYDELPKIDSDLDYTRTIYPSDEKRIQRAIETLGIKKEDLDYLKWMTNSEPEEKNEKVSALSVGERPKD